MAAYEIVPATVEHVAAMLPHIRQADIDEVAAASSRTPEQALLDGLRRSEGRAWTGLADGEVVCIFGVAPLTMLSTTGIPWMLGTPLVEQHSRVFLRKSKRFIRIMCGRYDRLLNYVDDRNTAAKEWLEWLGFTLHEPVPYGVKQMPFRMFTMGAE